ncbi:sulfatase [Aquimarina sp. 2201CG5-10]|uniref:sulfatase n=1 Tax=Aquimarina callyspongiae TaxID=3098150 RepID=UPI002AB3C647|nr:sulfatase [Aquimarina sp. 2201CG5-10]MDY8134170.1 sulfatase [Aquimarina sp. 2201CG5-10]
MLKNIGDMKISVKIIFILLICVSYNSCNSIQKNNVQKEVKPNILFILVDDLGWSDTSFMGNPVYETPNLDKLATEGVLFKDAYAPAANCAPSRASILSGKNTPEHGIYTVGSSKRGKSKDRKLIPIENKRVLDDSFLTIAEALKQNGYTSASIGKWHLGKDPRTQGFDINIGGTKAGHPKSYFSPYKNKALKDGKKGEYLTDRLTNEAISFIEKNKEKPFFLYLPYFTVHTPLQGKEELISKYETKINNDKRFNSKYGAMVESLDKNVGRLLHTLKELNIDKNTLVVFLSDNGGLASISSQFPLRAGKGSYYEGGIRVPCIIKWPNKIKGNRKTNIPITGMDIFPTLIDAVNDKKKYDLDGISLLPFLKNNQKIEERALFWHFPIYLEKVNSLKDQARDTLFRTRPGSVVRKGKWKLHQYFENNEFELYNLENDIQEQTDLSKQYPEKVKELLQDLNIFRKDKNAPIPVEINEEFIGE